jgi:hypothetical protein
MKNYLHIILNLLVSLILGILIALNHQNYFNVPQRLEIIDYLAIL